MSERFPGGIISKTAPVPTGPYETGTAPGIWTLDQQAEFVKQGIWPIAGLTPNYIEDVFSTWLYTGTSAPLAIVNGVDLAGEGGLVWSKWRSGANAFGHALYDTARGPTKQLQTQTTAEQTTESRFTSFNSNGYSLSGDTELDYLGDLYASWTFRKQPKFFDVVTWTGDDTSNRQIAHNLGSAPGCIILKSSSNASSWFVYHRSTGNDNVLFLNTTDAVTSSPGSWATSSTTFTLGNANFNISGRTYVAYLFAHNAGGFGLTGTDNVISCGSFTTDGSGNTALQDLGWEPQFLMTKVVSTTGNWLIQDSMRGFVSSTTGQRYLYPNLSNAESGATDGWQPTATGFQDVYASQGPGRTYIYIAIRRGPMKVPESGTSVFAPVARTGTGGATTQETGLNGTDLAFTIPRSAAGNNWQWVDRLRGGVAGSAARIQSNNTNQEFSDQSMSVLSSTQTTISYGGSGSNASSTSYIVECFRRAPSVFDVACYTGTGSVTTQTHNLGVVPELMIVKSRSLNDGWFVYSSALGASKVLELHRDIAAANEGSFAWNSTAPTSSVFTVGSSTGFVNTSGATYVAYLFASCPGVSKVGSYTGTGTTLQINCGFTTGARFVLIKRTDSTGDWYVWDSARGIVAGDDPYLLLNSTAAEVTNTDYVDTYSAGFEITSTAPAAINASGGSFIFLAIA